MPEPRHCWESERGGGKWTGIQVAKWAGLGVEGSGQERREYLLKELKEPIHQEGKLSLEGAEGVMA